MLLYTKKLEEALEKKYGKNFQKKHEIVFLDEKGEPLPEEK